MDKWILSRLSQAVEDVNKGFRDYDFPVATTALYDFWVYELCDVYFEALKPVIYYGKDEEAKEISRNVLYPVSSRKFLFFFHFSTEINVEVNVEVVTMNSL